VSVRASTNLRDSRRMLRTFMCSLVGSSSPTTLKPPAGVTGHTSASTSVSGSASALAPSEALPPAMEASSSTSMPAEGDVLRAALGPWSSSTSRTAGPAPQAPPGYAPRADAVFARIKKHSIENTCFPCLFVHMKMAYKTVMCVVVACLCPAAAYHMPVPGARAHRAFHQFNILAPLQPWPAAASLRGRAARCNVGLGANLNRQHDFGIDPNKVQRALGLWALSAPVIV